MNQIKEIVKKVIPRDKVWQLRLMAPGLPYRALLQDIEAGKYKDADYLIGTPLHDNLGDHLITLSELCLLDEIESNRHVVEIPLELYRLYSHKIKKGVSETSRILINGGGWMGDVWPDDELTIQKIVKDFPNNQVIIFPQTIYYESNSATSERIKKTSIEAYDNHGRLTMFVRERNSYDLAKELYQNVDVQLAPDIALYFIHKAPKRTLGKQVIGICLRDDKEVFYTGSIKDELFEFIEELDLDTKEISTIYGQKVSEDRRNKVVLDTLREFSSCSLVVTDRLHAMLFCYLTNTPCVVFDNKTRKVSGVYNEWLRGSSSIFPVFDEAVYNSNEAQKFITESLVKEYENDFSKEKFEDLRSLLINE